MKEILVNLDKCLGCKTCELRCAVERSSKSKSLYSAVRENPKPLPRIDVQSIKDGYLPLQCRHCEEAPCLNACPTGALFRKEDNGPVIVDENLCVGCWMCVMTCPFGAITPLLERKKIIKCDLCVNMERPVCVDACPTGALVYCDTQSAKLILEEKKGNFIQKVFSDTSEGIRRGLLKFDYKQGSSS
ncbi:4Fe-4S dicluster domain-containing protein [Candidatus Aerophobetes bacterium]|nr:4Fe-4S dicluster domain-containing protein [Candidatus Aerophobetes bacterium]